MNSIVPSFRHLPTTSAAAPPRHPSSTVNAPTDFLLLWRYQILDPDSDIVSYWNQGFLVVCIMALFIDPLYFFIPNVGGPGCLARDDELKVIITYIRSMADCFFFINILMKFRTAYVAPNTRVFGRGDLVTDARQIAMRYLKSDFVIDLAAFLPLTQIVIWVVLPSSKNSAADHTTNTVSLIVLLQYIPRFFLIFPLHRKIIKTTGVIAETTWAGAGYNLLLYLLASHVLGAIWYLWAISRQFSCWQQACETENAEKAVSCAPSFLDCNSLGRPERLFWQNVTRVITSCDATQDDVDFKFGMFTDAFKSKVAAENFVRKYLYCLWWGLRNLSSFAQNLDTSIYKWENVFCIVICMVGLILFALLIGNMQTILQSITVRVEEWRVRRKDTEEWMRHRQLPENLQERIRRFSQYQWLATRGVDEESILNSFPLDLRHEIQRHLCISLVRRVPFFSQVDDQFLDAIYERLVSSLSTEGTYIVREGAPVNEMLFIIRGQLESSTTDGGRSGFYNSITLKPGDFCGEELLTWALMPNSTAHLPSSTRTVRALTEVEAFALQAEDLQFFSHQFKKLQSKKFQHTFMYYSHQWRTWAAGFIQASWRRYKNRMMAKALATTESSNYYMPLPDQESCHDYVDIEGGQHYYQVGEIRRASTDNPNDGQHLGATILASKFAANARKRSHGQKVAVIDSPSSSLETAKPFIPDEPDYV